MADQERNLQVNLKFGVDAATNAKATQAASKLGSALDKLDQSSIKLMRAGMGLREIGDLFGNKMLSDVGKLTQGIGGLANSLGDVKNLVTSISKSPLALGGIAAAGGAVLGSSIYDATIGKMQGTSTGKIFDQLGKLLEYGFDTKRLTQDLRVQAINAQIDANNAVFNFKQGLSKNDPAANKVIGQILGAFGGLSMLGLGRLAPYGQAAQDVSDTQGKTKDDLTALNQMAAKLNAAATYQNKLAEASKTYHAAQFDRAMSLAKLEQDISQKRAAAAQSLAADLQKMESDYYANRLRAAQSFGLETTRLEEDHQRDMRRAAEDHGKRLRTLAESRDALAIEDEVDTYETERQRAEEDYQVQAARRNEDFAQQLRDLEDNFRRQRQTRIDQYNQQITELNDYLTAQRKVIADQFAAIAKAVMDAFTGAAQQYTQATGGISGTTTNNTTNARSVTQNNNFGAVSDPTAIKTLVYQGIIEAFGAV